MKNGRRRTMSICLTDIPKDKILMHANGKKYLAVETWDSDGPDKYDNDFSISVSRTKEEIEQIKAGATINRAFIGNGRIWEDKPTMRELTPEEIAKLEEDDLPF